MYKLHLVVESIALRGEFVRIGLKDFEKIDAPSSEIFILKEDAYRFCIGQHLETTIDELEWMT